MAAGVMVARLAILGHDAGHQGFSHSRTLNRFIGTLAFLPALHPFGRWHYHHNLIHHRFTCQLGIDNAFPPMSLEGYLEAPQWQRLKYRFLRSLLGQPFFYLLDIWLPSMFLPMRGPSTSPRYRDLLELFLVYIWLIVFLVLTTLLAAKT
ncbi:MAG: fatty acid desaturase, partial [Cyanobium sp.]